MRSPLRGGWCTPAALLPWAGGGRCRSARTGWCRLGRNAAPDGAGRRTSAVGAPAGRSGKSEAKSCDGNLGERLTFLPWMTSAKPGPCQWKGTPVPGPGGLQLQLYTSDDQLSCEPSPRCFRMFPTSLNVRKVQTRGPGRGFC